MRVRGDATAGPNCRLCGRRLMDHGLTEFCREGRKPAQQIEAERLAAELQKIGGEVREAMKSGARVRVHDPKKPRKPCRWPGCPNTVPLNWWFCTGRDCQNARLWARLLGGTRAEEAILIENDAYKRAQEKKWRSNKREYMRHYKRRAKELALAESLIR